MGRTTGFLQKGYTATAAIRANRLVTWGASDGTVIEATGATAHIPGVQSQLDCDSGDRASVAMNGNIEDVLYGGNVARGDPLTSDGQGRAIKATGAAGTLLNCVGFAEVSGVAGDIGTVIIAPFVMQGA